MTRQFFSVRLLSLFFLLIVGSCLTMVWLPPSVAGARAGIQSAAQSSEKITGQRSDTSVLIAAQLYRIKSNGQLAIEDVFLNQQARPIVFGPLDELDFLVLYLNGLPGITGGEELTGRLRLFIGGVEIVPEYAAPTQINARLPRVLEGRGKVKMLVHVTGTGLSAQEIAELQFGVPAGPAPPQIIGFDAEPVLAGSPLRILGNGFALAAPDNLVRIGDTDAQMREASSTWLSIIVPWGATSSPVSVRTVQGEGYSQQALRVRSSVSGFVETTDRKPLGKVTVRESFSGRTVNSAESGSFILPDPLIGAGVFEFDGPTAGVFPPYPRVMLKRIIETERDNAFTRPIALQQATGPAFRIPFGSGFGISPDENRHEAASADTADGNISYLLTSGPNSQSVQDGGIVFSTSRSITGRFPNGKTSGEITLTRVRHARTPVLAAPGVYSSAIVQLTPFRVQLKPGGQLLFPNEDNLPRNAEATLYKLDQTPTSPTVGEFIAVGKAFVSPDGSRIETGAYAITETSMYFVTIPRPVTTIAGRVVDQNGNPLRNVIARTLGREALTDGNGGFIIQEVIVSQPAPATAAATIASIASGAAATTETADRGIADRETAVAVVTPITVEVSLERPSGMVARAERSGLIPIPNGVTKVVPDIVLKLADETGGVETTLPFSLTMSEGEVRELPLTVPAQATSVAVAGAEFASVLRHNSEAILRLIPGFNDAGTYPLVVTMTSPTGNVAYQITLIVLDVSNGNPTNHPPVIQLNPAGSNDNQLTLYQGDSVLLTASATDPDPGQQVALAVTDLPVGWAAQNQTSANLLISTADAVQGNYIFKLTATDNGQPPLSTTLSVPVTVLPCPPSATLPTRIVDAGLPLTGTLLLPGETLTGFTFNVTGGVLPPGVTLASTTGEYSGTPTAIGVFGFTVTASQLGGACSFTRTQALNVHCPAALFYYPTGGDPGGPIRIAVGDSFSQTPVLSNAPPVIGYQLVSGALPAGLFLDRPTGEISGIPLRSGTSDFTIEVMTGYGCRYLTMVSIEAVTPPTIKP